VGRIIAPHGNFSRGIFHPLTARAILTGCANNQDLPGLLAHLRDPSRGVGMRKIDNSLAFWKRGRQIVPDIDLGDNFEFRIGRRAGNESLSHTAFSTVDEQFERGHESVRSLESFRQAARRRV
jgi:hypothetical protein